MTNKPNSEYLAECSRKPKLEERPIISEEQALDLASVFKVLANDTRLRLLHTLIHKGTLSVNDLSSAVDMKPQAVSNQLQKLVDRGIVSFKRNGNRIFYRILDPCVMSLLDRGLCLMEDVKEER